MKEFEITPYPFKAGVESEIVRGEIDKGITRLLATPPFLDINQEEVLENFYQYFKRAETLFGYEETLRENGEPKANLYYHNKDHALYQATHDALQITNSVLARNDKLASHLTTDGAYAIILAAMHHDIGYVNNPTIKNFAARTPIHVGESMFVFWYALREFGLPEGFDFDRIQRLGLLGIHSTNFPYSEDHKKESELIIDGMTPEEKKEANIVRLAVKFADLGGQSARIDQNPYLLKQLRREMNESNPGTGDQIIGSDYNLYKNCSDFIEQVVIPTVGKTANAFLGEKNPYLKAWKRNIITYKTF